MPTSTATKFLLGKGSTFSVSTDGGTTFTPVKQQKTITFSGAKTDYDDITNLDSPGAVREFVPTLIDPGTASLQGVFLDSDPGQTAVSAAFDAYTLLSCKLQFAPGVGQSAGFLRTFSAYVSQKPTIDAQMDKVSTYAAELKVTGPFTDTPAVSGS